MVARGVHATNWFYMNPDKFQFLLLPQSLHFLLSSFLFPYTQTQWNTLLFFLTGCPPTLRINLPLAPFLLGCGSNLTNHAVSFTNSFLWLSVQPILFFFPWSRLYSLLFLRNFPVCIKTLIAKSAFLFFTTNLKLPLDFLTSLMLTKCFPPVDFTFIPLPGLLGQT